MARWASLLEIDDENWDWSHDMNVRHAFLVSQELGKRMVATGGGTMVFIASASGFSAAPMHAAYGVAKAGLMAYVQSLAVELGPLGVRANAIAPGVVLTPRMEAAFTAEQRVANSAVVPLGRMGSPVDIASGVLFLTSDLSSFVSGRTILVDGAVARSSPMEPVRKGGRDGEAVRGVVIRVATWRSQRSATNRSWSARLGFRRVLLPAGKGGRYPLRLGGSFVQSSPCR